MTAVLPVAESAISAVALPRTGSIVSKDASSSVHAVAADGDQRVTTSRLELELLLDHFAGFQLAGDQVALDLHAGRVDRGALGERTVGQALRLPGDRVVDGLGLEPGEQRGPGWLGLASLGGVASRGRRRGAGAGRVGGAALRRRYGREGSVPQCPRVFLPRVGAQAPRARLTGCPRTPPLTPSAASWVPAFRSHRTPAGGSSSPSRVTSRPVR
jgi:hypothetical protein